MRTTVTVDDDLLGEAKATAARGHRTIASVLEDALREMLARHRESEARRGPASLPVSGRAGDQPLIDILDRTSGRRPRRERPSVILIDVNVGVYAFRREHARHAVAREWLTRMATGPEPVTVGDDVLCALVRITTNHRVLRHPATPAEALSSCAALRSMPSVIPAARGPRRWHHFAQLVESRPCGPTTFPMRSWRLRPSTSARPWRRSTAASPASPASRSSRQRHSTAAEASRGARAILRGRQDRSS